MLSPCPTRPIHIGRRWGSRWPFDEFHDECRQAPRLFETMNVRDVRMVESRQDLRFSAEARETVGITGERVWQDFDRDLAV